MSIMTYPVNELFLSVQFEGTNSGFLNFFIRLAHCNRNCTFCDTDYRDNVWQQMTADEILQTMLEMSTSVKRVILTGGEPSLHDLKPLLEKLKSAGYYIAIESNGDFIEKLYEWKPLIDWITVSPKGKVDSTKLQLTANEVKYIVPDHGKLIDWTLPVIFLQPEWNNKEAFKECRSLLEAHPDARISIQSHKYLNIR